MSLSQQQSPPGEDVSLKHQLLKVVVRVAQYRMLLTGESREAERGVRNLHMKMPHHILSLLVATTDYLNNLSPDSKEYEDTQGTINRRQQCVDTGEPYWPPLVALCYRVISLSFGRERESHKRANLDFLFMALTCQVVISALLCL